MASDWEDAGSMTDADGYALMFVASREQGVVIRSAGQILARLETGQQHDEFTRAYQEARRIAGGQPPALTVAAVTPELAEAAGEIADAAQRMAIDPDGKVKPVAEFTAEEKWWCDGEECDGYPIADAPHVHVAGFETWRVDLLTGKGIDAAQEAGAGG